MLISLIVWRRSGVAALWDPDFPLDIFHSDIPPPGQFLSLLHGVGHPPFRHHHSPIYKIERSTVNVYKIDRCRSVRVRSTASFQNITHVVDELESGPRVVGQLGSDIWISASFQKKSPASIVGRLRSGVWVSASFQIFASTAGAKCPRWRGKLSVRSKCPGNVSEKEMSYTQRFLPVQTLTVTHSPAFTKIS